MIKNVFFVPITIIRILRFLFIINLNKNKKIYLIDIDNTIADSWHSLLQKDIWQNEKERVKDLPVFIGMRKLVTHLQKKENTKLIFFTARSMFSVNATFKWLKESGLATQSSQLVVTRTAYTKYIFLKCIFFPIKKIVYIDDLSHKHEEGSPIFFTETIQSILLLQKHRTNILYLDASFINKINSEYVKSAEEITNDFLLY
jgi:hypothetical protein